MPTGKRGNQCPPVKSAPAKPSIKLGGKHSAPKPHAQNAKK